MTLHATRRDDGHITIGLTYGPIRAEITEHPGHVRGFWSQLGDVLDEAEGQEHTAAHRAYEAYREHCGGKSVHGEELPAWDDQAPEIREHWEAAAAAIS